MRKIKFRAWDNLHKRITPLDFVKNSDTKNDDWDSRFIPMQFTGLPDKNGREIYEGDILIEKRELLSRKYKVWFEEGGFVINEFQDDFTRPINQIHFWQGLSDMQTASFVKQNCEVIGNIYEHPHLLEK